MTEHFIPVPAKSDKMSILVIDDSRLQRRILISALTPLGYHVRDTSSGEEALELCRQEMPDIVISDWVMSGMSGLDLCSRLRELCGEHYVYFIILTSKSEKGELAEALSAGADDFLSKPLSADEMRGRIVAGERLLRMGKELREKNRLVSSTLSSIREINVRLDRDLADARKLQMSLTPRESLVIGDWRVSFLLQPSGHVGGDLVGYFPISKTRVGIFSLDVSGHGVAAALVTARLSSWFAGTTSDTNVALRKGPQGFEMDTLAEVCSRLNERFLSDLQSGHYFTIVLGQLDLETGDFHFAQAGHPHPMLIRSDGQNAFVGRGGPPIGLLPDMVFEGDLVTIDPGDRLLIYSDGLTECTGRNGNLLDEDGLAALVDDNRALQGRTFLKAIEHDLTEIAADGDLRDDMSAVLIERVGLGWHEAAPPGRWQEQVPVPGPAGP